MHFSQPRPQLEREAVTGVGAQPVSVIEHDGLGGAISELRKADSDPDVGSVLAYESVAKTFFRQRTIIPMRYGCAVHNRRDFGPLIDKHRKECDTLLRRLEGLAEMAIQVSASGGEEDDEICLAAIPQTRWPHPRIGRALRISPAKNCITAAPTAKSNGKTNSPGRLPPTSRVVCRAQSGTAFLVQRLS